MNQKNRSRTFENLSKKELMNFIITLNKCMQDYDDDIEYRMKCSEGAEWDSLKSSPSSKNLSKRLQYVRNIKR